MSDFELPHKMRSVIIIPVHNRRQTTERCLRNLDADGVLKWAKIVVVDDGSTDGTGELLRREWPSVEIISGDGQLWWGGAILEGMRWAHRYGADFYFWLNDDCLPEPGCLELLKSKAQNTDGIAVAVSIANEFEVYGGVSKTMWGMVPLKIGDADLKCDAFGGNCVCIPASVVQKIGFVDAKHFPHSFCDADYGLRASKEGISLIVCSKCRCSNESNASPYQTSWLLSPTPILTHWKGLLNRKSMLHFSSRFYLNVFHWGYFWGGVLLLLLYGKLLVYTLIRSIVPLNILRKFVGGRSVHFQRKQLNDGDSKSQPG